jgi:hypothetical protein
MSETETVRELRRVTKRLKTTESKADDLRFQQRLLIKQALAEGLRGVDVAKIAEVSKSWIWQVHHDYVRPGRKNDD